MLLIMWKMIIFFLPKGPPQFCGGFNHGGRRRQDGRCGGGRQLGLRQRRPADGATGCQSKLKAHSSNRSSTHQYTLSTLQWWNPSSNQQFSPRGVAKEKKRCRCSRSSEPETPGISFGSVELSINNVTYGVERGSLGLK